MSLHDLVFEAAARSFADLAVKTARMKAERQARKRESNPLLKLQRTRLRTLMPPTSENRT